jgi:hypothetical protein
LQIKILKAKRTLAKVNKQSTEEFDEQIEVAEAMQLLAERELLLILIKQS